MTVADVNGDRRPDVIVTNEGSNDVSIFLNDPTMLLRPGPRLNAGIAPVQTQVGDFLGSGQQQLMIVNSGSNNVSLLPALGGGFFNDVSPMLFATGASPQAAVVGNFFGGTGLDLVTLNYLSNTLTVYNGFDANRRQDISSGGEGPLSGVAGDFLQTGTTDLVIGNNTNGAFAVFVGGLNGLIEADTFFDADVLHPTALALAGSAERQDLRLLVADEGDENVQVFNVDQITPSMALVNDTFGSVGGNLGFSFGLGNNFLFTSVFAIVEQISDVFATSAAEPRDPNGGGGGRESQSGNTFAFDQVPTIFSGGIHWLTSTVQTAADSIGIHHLPDDVLDSVESLLQIVAPAVPWRVINVLFDGSLSSGNQTQHDGSKPAAADQALDAARSMRESSAADNLLAAMFAVSPQTGDRLPNGGSAGNELAGNESAAGGAANIAFWEGVAEQGIGAVVSPLEDEFFELASNRLPAAAVAPKVAAASHPSFARLDIEVPFAPRRNDRQPASKDDGRAALDSPRVGRQPSIEPLSFAALLTALPSVLFAGFARNGPEQRRGSRSHLRSDRPTQGKFHARRR